jgi:hypothetical protein
MSFYLITIFSLILIYIKIILYLIKLVFTIRIINLALSKKSRVIKVSEEVKSILGVFIVS